MKLNTRLRKGQSDESVCSCQVQFSLILRGSWWKGGCASGHVGMQTFAILFAPDEKVRNALEGVECWTLNVERCGCWLLKRRERCNGRWDEWLESDRWRWDRSDKRRNTSRPRFFPPVFHFYLFKFILVCIYIRIMYIYKYNVDKIQGGLSSEAPCRDAGRQTLHIRTKRSIFRTLSADSKLK